MKFLQEIYNLIEPTPAKKAGRDDLIKPSSTDIGASEMKYPNFYKVKDLGAKTKVSKKKVMVRRSSDGRVYGRRTIYSK
jgi:hypothetical protein